MPYSCDSPHGPPYLFQRTVSSNRDTAQGITPDLENGLAPRHVPESGEFVDNQDDCLFRRIGARGHYIQSQVFRIPEEWGIFSPGPPVLQIHEGRAFASVFFTVFIACPIMITGSYFVWRSRGYDWIFMMLWGFLLALQVVMYFVLNRSHRLALRYFRQDREMKSA